MLHYLTVAVTAIEQNCSILWEDNGRHAVVIDPGGDLPKIVQVLEQQQLSCQAIWLTHAHIDHVGAATELAALLSVPIIGPHSGDAFWLEGLPRQSQMFGFPLTQSFTPTRWLHDGDTLTVGEHTIQVRHCPGHTPGHVVFYAADIGRAFVGDVLFAGSVGRTDLPQGNHADLIRSIRERLWPMGDDTIFIPGHGPESSFGQERRSNPYVRDGA